MKIFNGTPSAYTESLAKKMAPHPFSWTDNPAEKSNCDVLLYAITPELKGAKHIVDLVNDSNHSTSKTVVCTLLDAGEGAFNDHQKKSLIATGKMVQVNGGTWLESEAALIDFLTKKS